MGDDILPPYVDTSSSSHHYGGANSIYRTAQSPPHSYARLSPPLRRTSGNRPRPFADDSMLGYGLNVAK